MLRESSTDFLAEGYIIEDLQDKLRSIIKYASLDYHIEVANNPVSYDIQKANEYAITLIRLWDEMDRRSIDELERVIVNLEGSLIGESNPELKALRTQITDYLTVRREQDKE